MSCQHQNNGICSVCMQGIQQQNMAQQAQLNPTAYYSIGQSAILSQQMARQAPFPFDEDYELFKRYAHLTDGELLNKYAEEQTAAKQEMEKEILQMQQQYEKERNQHKDTFWNWCKKYRQNLTEERFEKSLKAFL